MEAWLEAVRTPRRQARADILPGIGALLNQPGFTGAVTHGVLMEVGSRQYHVFIHFNPRTISLSPNRTQNRQTRWFHPPPPPASSFAPTRLYYDPTPVATKEARSIHDEW